MAFKKRCGPCRGTGYYLVDPRDTCQICGGTGTVSLQGQPDDYKTCSPCSGSGYYLTDPTDTCRVCKGLGVIRLQEVSPIVRGKPTKAGESGMVFLVHGHNTTVRDRISSYLAKGLGLHVKVMEAEAHSGRTLPEKFEEIAQECSFAVFLMTADDQLRTSDGREVRRARQNVVLEIGYFWGAFGRRKKVALLAEQGIDMPSDIHGIAWIPITADLDETMLGLRKELEDAGLVARAANAV
jgi:predicted nucleotide-binding protein